MSCICPRPTVETAQQACTVDANAAFTVGAAAGHIGISQKQWQKKEQQQIMDWRVHFMFR